MLSSPRVVSFHTLLQYVMLIYCSLAIILFVFSQELLPGKSGYGIHLIHLAGMTANYPLASPRKTQRRPEISHIIISWAPCIYLYPVLYNYFANIGV